jgi:lysozyme
MSKGEADLSPATNKVSITPIRLSIKGAHFIGNFEGFRSMAYLDGGGLPTIGYGTRIKSMNEYPNGITIETAATFLQGSVASIIQGLTDLQLDLPLPNHQDAVISLTYNIGIGAFRKSIIFETLKAKGTDLYAWSAWTRDAKGVVEPGLTERRELEMKCFIYGVYGNL